MRPILLTGADGQVGWELRRCLAVLGDVVACRRGDLDLADPDALAARVRELRPAAVVNAAAYTAVDQAETDTAAADAINARAPGILAEQARAVGAWFVHYSTDYVFDGTKPVPYEESDAPCPANAYGRGKRAGEAAVQAVGGRYLVLRTSWVYAGRGRNFLRTMLRLGAERDELKVVADQHGAPTWARSIAEGTLAALAIALRDSGTGLSGIYHMTCAGRTTWHGFAQAIFEDAALARRPMVHPIPTSDYPLPAPRPANSVLSNDKFERAFGVRLPEWRHALRLCLEEMGARG